MHAKATSAVEKAVALATSIEGPMTEPCPVCRGGYWCKDGELRMAVHHPDCPRANDNAR